MKNSIILLLNSRYSFYSILCILLNKKVIKLFLEEKKECKKLITLAMIITIAASAVFSGCSAKIDVSSDTGGATDAVSNEVTSADTSSDSGTDKLAESIEVTPYVYEDTTGCSYLVLVMKNTSDTDFTLKINVQFENSNGKVVENLNDDVNAFSSGTEVAKQFSCDRKYATYKYNFETSQTDYNIPINQNLKHTESINGNTVTITAENTGDIAAEFVDYTILFFKGDTLVRCDDGYISDNAIKPGETAVKEEDCSQEFDNVKVYLNGIGEFKV